MTAQASNLQDALDLKISTDSIFYGDPDSAFQEYQKERLKYLRSREVARKTAADDQRFSWLDVVATAPYETDVAFEPTDSEGKSSGQYFPNAAERFLQLDFLDNVLDPENQNPMIIEKRQKLIQEGYRTPDGQLDTDKLSSLHNPEQYEAFKEYVFSNEDLEGIPYEIRERPRANVLRLPTGLKIPTELETGEPALSNITFDINERQRAQYAGRGADPDQNYMSIVANSGLQTEDGTNAITDLNIGRTVSPYDLDKKELENLLHRFDKSAVVQYLDFNDPKNGEFIVTSDLTGGKPVPFGNVQPLESLFKGDVDPITNELLVFLGQEGPKAALGGGFIKLLRTGIKKGQAARIRRNVEKIDKGETVLEKEGVANVLGQMAGYASVSGLGEALGEAARLYYGRQSGRQPDMTHARIWEAAGLAGIAAAGGEAVGELALKGFVKVSDFFTGQRLPESLLNRLRASAEYLKRKKRIPLEDLPEADPEVSIATMNEFFTELGGEVGEELATLGELTNDKVLQAITTNLINAQGAQGLGINSPGRAALEAIKTRNNEALNRYYNSLLVRLQPDQELDRETFNQAINRFRLELQQGKKIRLEDSIAGIERQIELEEQIPGVLDPQAGSADLAEEVQKIITGGRPSYPEESSELMLMYRDFVEPIRAKYPKIFERKATDLKTGEEFAVYQEPVVPLPKYISEQLKNMLFADKPEGRIFGTADDAEVAELIRKMLPNREAEGISIQQLADPELFEKQRRFSIQEITQTMDDLELMFSSHPSRKVRDEGKKLLDALADARSEAYRIQYKKITGDTRAPTEARAKDKYEREVLSVVGGDINEVKQEVAEGLRKVDGRYFYQLATKEPAQLGAYILNSKPSNIDGLLEVLTQTPEGLAKLQQVKQLVFNAIDQQIAGDGAGAAIRAQRFARLSSRNQEQLSRLFPDVELSPKKFQAIRKQLQDDERALAQVERIIERMVNPYTGQFVDTPVEVLDAYFSMSPAQKRDFRGTRTFNDLVELSDLADEYPELRAGLQTDLLRRMRNMTGVDAEIMRGDQFVNASDRLDSGFSLNDLQDFTLAYSTTQEFAEDLALVVGDDLAPDYAKNLRNFTRRLRKLVTQKEAPGLGETRLQSIMEAAAGTLTRARKAYFGVLSRAGLQSNLILEELGPRVADDLAIILANPEKLDFFMKRYDTKRLPLGDIPRVLTQIALGREGAEAEEETELDQFKRKITEEFDLFTPFSTPAQSKP